MKQKCIHCDGLGYVYSVATFRSEICTHCEGKGYVEISHDLGGPVVEQPVVEAPKPTKKSTKTPVETPVEPTIKPQADVEPSEE